MAEKSAEPETSGKEYFAESEYGVTASPRVAASSSDMPRGGGREQVGKPYQIGGKWYRPKEDPDYRASGLASWYGDAFHGRLTANGEVYDMTHLTAAHPTMPLPSYARVTNANNGSSLIVRVNDRGPFHDDRVIDLSRQAADLLDFAHSGVARVDVEYLGRAPLHGKDDSFLMASYDPGDAAPGGADGVSPGVMIAMNGSAPSDAVAAFPGQLTTVGRRPAAPAAEASVPELPDSGPVLPSRPAIGLADATDGRAHDAPPVLAYADDRPVGTASRALSAFAQDGSDTEAVRDPRSRQTPTKKLPLRGDYIAVGTFDSRGEAMRMAALLDHLGDVELAGAGELATVTLMPDGARPFDAVLREVWRSGAPDAMTVRAD